MPLTIHTQPRGSPIPMRARDAPALTILRDSAPQIRGSPGYMEPPMRRNRGPPFLPRPTVSGQSIRILERGKSN